MNTRIWKKLWAFLNQPLFEQNSAKVNPDLELLERCWNMFYIQDAESDLQLDLELLERCWNMFYIQEVESDLQLDLELLERCWNKSYVQPKYDR
jgi:hypothetical protein